MGAVSFEFAPLDIAVVITYLVVVLAIAFIVARKTETGDDMFLAGRSLTYPAIGFSFFASNISSTTLIGLAGAAYTTGIAVANYEWMAAVILIFMSFYVLPVFLKAQISTIPEYLEMRFNRAGRLYFSALTIILSIIVDTAGGIFAGAVVLQVFIPELDLIYTCFALAIFTGLYTAVGGLKAVVFTDVIQAIVLIIGCTILTYIIFSHHGFSWGAIKDSMPEGHLSLLKPIAAPGYEDAPWWQQIWYSGGADLPWLGTLIGVPLLGFWYWGANQYITQRLLGAKSLDHARRGALLGGFLKLTPLFIMVLPGAMAISLFPNIEQPNQVFPILVRELMPVGLVGLVLAGLLAAIMSSIDSTLNSASTLIVKDFILNEKSSWKPSEKTVGWMGRIATIVLMLIAASWAPQIRHFENLFTYLQESFAIVVPPVVAILLLGLFCKNITAQASFLTLIIGHAIGVILFLGTKPELPLGHFWHMHFSITVGIMTLFCALLAVVLSKFTPRSSDAVLDATLWKPEMIAVARTVPWYANFKYQSYGMLVLIVIMLVAFW